MTIPIERNTHFTIMNKKGVRDLRGKLSDAQIGTLFAVQSFIGDEYGTLRNREGSPMSYQELRKEVGHEERKATFSLFVKKAIMSGIIHVIEPYEEYAINTKYFRVGDIEDYASELYVNRRAVKELLESVPFAMIGRVALLTSLVSGECNALSSDCGEPLSLKSSAELLDISLSSAKRVRGSVKLRGEPVILREYCGEGSAAKTVISPELVRTKGVR